MAHSQSLFPLTEEKRDREKERERERRKEREREKWTTFMPTICECLGILDFQCYKLVMSLVIWDELVILKWKSTNILIFNVGKLWGLQIGWLVVSTLHLCRVQEQQNDIPQLLATIKKLYTSSWEIFPKFSLLFMENIMSTFLEQISIHCFDFCFTIRYYQFHNHLCFCRL